MKPTVPDLRIRVANDAPIHATGDFVVYWMIAQRRTTWNFGLDRAVELARECGKPLLIFEALRCDYRWANDRIHRFVLEGMIDNAAACAREGVFYYPYVESHPGTGRGLLAALADRSCAVVTDEFPCSFLPRMIAAAAKKLAVRFEVVDSNGLVPLSTTPRAFATAHAFRRWLQRHLPRFLDTIPTPNPLRAAGKLGTAKLPRRVSQRWPATELGGDIDVMLAGLPIDHTVGAGALRGGSASAKRLLKTLSTSRIKDYDAHRNEPDQDGTSGLSPLLHFGHVSTHQVVHAVLDTEDWHPDRLATTTTGAREGWWGVSKSTETFLDQIVTWRELGYVFAYHRPKDYRRFDSLPSWALQTHDEHREDAREFVYTREEFERAETHDKLWNAAQRQLVEEGRMHNYLRMLWGKKILEWSPDPEAALEVMVELNNKYALDGRDPNSYSGIFWVLGRFDRAWGPERRVFGKVRYMSSENTARKHPVADYIARWT